MAHSHKSSADKFAARVNAGRDIAAPELLALCTEELDIKTAVLDGLADAILVHTIEGDLLYFNPATAIIWGFNPNEFAKLGRYEWVPLEQRIKVDERSSTLRETGVLDFQSRGLTADGSTIATEVHARLVDLPSIGTVVVSVIQDITERAAAQELMKHLAYHDTLTGLSNRVMLDERLRMAMASADRHGDIVGVVFLDLDAFKPINDTFGHSVGDHVLKTVATRLTHCIREYDTVARVGGDEFLMLFPRLKSHKELGSLGRKIQACIGAPIDLSGREVTISATMGLAIYARGEAPDELISRADHEMYRARVRGVDGWRQAPTPADASSMQEPR